MDPKKFEQLVDHFIGNSQLGDYDQDRWSITLYDIPNRKEIIDMIHRDIRKVTQKYKLIITQPNEKISNVNILDIGL